MSKKRVVREFQDLPAEVSSLIQRSFPGGFDEHLISLKDKDGNTYSALPFETEDVYYLVKLNSFSMDQLAADEEEEGTADYRELQMDNFEEYFPDANKEEETKEYDVYKDYEEEDAEGVEE